MRRFPPAGGLLYDDQRSIFFVNTVADVGAVVRRLRDPYGLTAIPYFADHPRRCAQMSTWARTAGAVLVSTTAGGLGIDRSAPLRARAPARLPPSSLDCTFPPTRARL